LRFGGVRWRSRTITLLVFVMAISTAVYEFALLRALRRFLAGQWAVGVAGAASGGYALVFLSFVFGWMKLNPGSPTESLRWLGLYFGFSAISMIGLALLLLYGVRLGRRRRVA
jgi:hypothetical protein